MYKPRIIVDKRELRSKLPGALYFSGFNLIPMWLTYGDYIISDDIVIERKSVNDFFQSVKSERLFKQIKQMKKDKEGNLRFSSIYILIEFEKDDYLAQLNRSLDFIKSKIKLYRENYNNPNAKLDLAAFEVLIKNYYPNVEFLHSFSPE